MRAQKKVLMIIAQKDFRDEEYSDPRSIFEEVGLQVVVASEKKGDCIGKLGLNVIADLDLADVNPADFDAFVFIGGPGSSQFFHDPEALNLVKEAISANKIIAAICIAPSILANADILQGKRATAWISEKPNLVSKGAVFTGKSVEQDGNIITADGPESSEEFGYKISQALEYV